MYCLLASTDRSSSNLIKVSYKCHLSSLRFWSDPLMFSARCSSLERRHPMLKQGPMSQLFTFTCTRRFQNMASWALLSFCPRSASYQLCCFHYWSGPDLHMIYGIFFMLSGSVEHVRLSLLLRLEIRYHIRCSDIAFHFLIILQTEIHVLTGWDPY